tara:strand:+ start:323 stop:532 length:210 start_codon:yes stop_codon:yes gene_type:complete
MKLTTQRLKQLIKEELGRVLLTENLPGYYIELSDGIYNEDPYETEEEAKAAIPNWAKEEYPEPKIIKQD